MSCRPKYAVFPQGASDITVMSRAVWWSRSESVQQRCGALLEDTKQVHYGVRCHVGSGPLKWRSGECISRSLQQSLGRWCFRWRIKLYLNIHSWWLDELHTSSGTVCLYSLYFRSPASSLLILAKTLLVQNQSLGLYWFLGSYDHPSGPSQTSWNQLLITLFNKMNRLFVYSNKETTAHEPHQVEYQQQITAVLQQHTHTSVIYQPEQEHVATAPPRDCSEVLQL